MNVLFRLFFLLIPLLFSCSARGDSGKEGNVTLKIEEEWSNFYGGDETILHVFMACPGSFPGRLQWCFSVHGRVAVRGEREIAVPGSTPARAEIPLRIPPVNEGVIVPAVLSLSVSGRDSKEIEGELEKRLWIFPQNPFAHQSAWLKERNIHLFDPVGKTAGALEALHLPFELVRNPDALSQLRGSLLIIGEGLSLREYRGLGRILLQAAARGNPALCLAPREGTIVLPGTEGSESTELESVILQKKEFIQVLDKRLDATFWSSGKPPLLSGMVIQARGSAVLGEFQGSGRGWPWVEFSFGGEGANAAFCGFGIIEHWEEGPTPRFLFARILEHLIRKKDGEQ